MPDVRGGKQLLRMVSKNHCGLVFALQCFCNGLAVTGVNTDAREGACVGAAQCTSVAWVSRKPPVLESQNLALSANQNATFCRSGNQHRFLTEMEVCQTGTALSGNGSAI